MNRDSTQYCLSFLPGSFSPDDLVQLVQRDLGFSKDRISPDSSHKTIRFSEKILPAFRNELEKRMGFSIEEGEDYGGRNLRFAIPAHRIPPETIWWHLNDQQSPPAEVFNDLLSHPGFVFAYAEDYEDSYRQNTEWPGNYIPPMKPENVKWTVNKSGQKVIDISGNPGRNKIVKNARLGIGWKMWFGKESRSWFPREMLLAFNQAQKISELPNDVIEVQLFKEPKGALRDLSLREVQKAFRRHIGLDKLIEELDADVWPRKTPEQAQTNSSPGSGSGFKNFFTGLFGAKMKPAAPPAKPRSNPPATPPVSGPPSAPPVSVQPAMTPNTSPPAVTPGPDLPAAPLAPSGSPSGPDRPVPFGYKCAWFAIKTEKPESLIPLFAGHRFKPSTWQEAGSYNDLYITPVVAGWTFYVGGDVLTPDTPKGLEEIEKLLIRASALGKACYFASFRTVDYYSWACAENGRLLRGYCEGESEIIWDAGEKQGIEKTFVYPQEAANDPDSFQQDIPDEGMVIRIAADWSLDPTTLDQFTCSGHGYVAGN
jgi:hypothetical protein